MACRQIIKLAASLKVPLEAIGVNCSAPHAISQAIPLISPLVEGSGIKLCAYGNCFQTTTSEWIESLKEDSSHNKATNKKNDVSAQDYDHNGYLLPCAYARFAREWADLGVKIIGGCCGSRPNHLKHVASILRDYNNKQ